MRVLIKKPGEMRPTLIEAAQLMQHTDDYVAFIIASSEYSRELGYTRYLSTSPVDKAVFDRWCSTLLRSGYLDTTSSSIFFDSKGTPKPD